MPMVATSSWRKNRAVRGQIGLTETDNSRCKATGDNQAQEAQTQKQVHAAKLSGTKVPAVAMWIL